MTGVTPNLPLSIPQRGRFGAGCQGGCQTSHGQPKEGDRGWVTLGLIEEEMRG
jgi:hypothetical protein